MVLSSFLILAFSRAARHFISFKLYVDIDLSYQVASSLRGDEDGDTGL